MLPAELFPTKYRGTFYGIAVASGKAGTILIQIIVHFRKATAPASDKWPLAIMLMCFSPLVLIGAFVAWVWIPDVQQSRDEEWEEMEKKGARDYKQRLLMPPRSLEDITKEPTKGQPFGIREHIRTLFDEDSMTATVDVEANVPPSPHIIPNKD